MRIDHIGVVVPDLEQGIKEYRRNGFKKESPIVEIPSRGIRVVFLGSTRVPSGPNIELIQIVKDGIELAPVHVAFSGIFAAEWNQINELACKLIQEGKGQWEPIPELEVEVLFYTGPGGELLELVNHASAGYRSW